MWNMYLEREDSKVVGKRLTSTCCVMTSDLYAHVTLDLRFLPADLFVGQLKSCVTCTVCGFCSTVFEPFWDLSIPVAQVRTHRLP